MEQLFSTAPVSVSRYTTRSHSSRRQAELCSPPTPPPAVFPSTELGDNVRSPSYSSSPQLDKRDCLCEDGVKLESDSESPPRVIKRESDSDIDGLVSTAKRIKLEHAEYVLPGVKMELGEDLVKTESALSDAVEPDQDRVLSQLVTRSIYTRSSSSSPPRSSTDQEYLTQMRTAQSVFAEPGSIELTPLTRRAPQVSPLRSPHKPSLRDFKSPVSTLPLSDPASALTLPNSNRVPVNTSLKAYYLYYSGNWPEFRSYISSHSFAPEEQAPLQELWFEGAYQEYMGRRSLDFLTPPCRYRVRGKNPLPPSLGGIKYSANKNFEPAIRTVLDGAFENGMLRPSPIETSELAGKTGLSYHQVKLYFKNKRNRSNGNRKPRKDVKGIQMKYRL